MQGQNIGKQIQADGSLGGLRSGKIPSQRLRFQLLNFGIAEIRIRANVSTAVDGFERMRAKG